MLLRYWNTLRYLRPVQIYGRLWFRLHRPRPDERAAPPVREPAGGWAVAGGAAGVDARDGDISLSQRDAAGGWADGME